MDRETGTAIQGFAVEEELELKERAMDEAPVGITISDPESPDNPLIYLNDRFEEMTGYPKDEVLGRNCRFLQGEDSDPETVADMRDAIDAGESVSVELINYRKNGTPFWNKIDIAPILDDSGDISHFVGFQTDVTERKEAEFQVQRERENLEHLVDRINGVLGDVTAGVVEATSREEVEQVVCERITAIDAYSFAWVGGIELGGDRLTPRASAGQLGLGDSGGGWELAAGSDPVVKAVESGELQLVTDLAEVEPDGPTFRVLEDETGEFEGIAAIPLKYRDTTYGVLVVYTPDSSVLDERESVVLAAIGRAVATTLHAIEGRRILAADSVIDLELELRDPDLFFSTVSARADCPVEYEGSVYQSDGRLLLFFSAETDAETIREIAAEHPETDVTVLTEYEDATSFELSVEADSLVGVLAGQGANTRGIRATNGVRVLRLSYLRGVMCGRLLIASKLTIQEWSWCGIGSRNGRRPRSVNLFQRWRSD